MQEIWLVLENEERKGTDQGMVNSAWSSEALAEVEVARISKLHGWNEQEKQYTRKLRGEPREFNDWCLCHDKDWRVDGPHFIDKEGDDGK